MIVGYLTWLRRILWDKTREGRPEQHMGVGDGPKMKGNTQTSTGYDGISECGVD